jgi:protein tyrosine phosphatase (PTP) superfamily phosphohydrolase (DUF442 family)
MEIEKITNYINVSNIIASSGQPKELEIKYIAQSGFDVVINLAMPNSDNAIPEEGYIVTARKMKYIHIPVPFERPTLDHIKDFISIMNAFKGKKVWIHCALNYRVSAFLFLYMKLIENKPLEEAKKVILKSWEPNDVWSRFMEISKDEISL